MFVCNRNDGVKRCQKSKVRPMPWGNYGSDPHIFILKRHNIEFPLLTGREVCPVFRYDAIKSGE